MTGPVWYCTRWNDLTRRPIAGYEWIDADHARGLRTRHEFFDVVDAETIEDGLPRPRWVIHTSASFGVDFFDVHGSIWRTVVYRWTDERLWRLTTTDYTYPDGEQRWDLPDATSEVEASVLPDGTGQLIVDDATAGTKSFSEFNVHDVPSRWLDVPEFGDWDALTDPGPPASEIAQGA